MLTSGQFSVILSLLTIGQNLFEVSDYDNNHYFCNTLDIVCNFFSSAAYQWDKTCSEVDKKGR